LVYGYLLEGEMQVPASKKRKKEKGKRKKENPKGMEGGGVVEIN